MITLDFSIQDVHGNTHTKAVILIGNIQYSCNTTISSAVDVQSGLRTTATPQGQNHLNFNAYLWPNIEAFNNKRIPMAFRTPSGSDWHNLPMASPVTDPETLEVLCEQHLLASVIPTLAVIPDPVEA